MDDKEQGRPDDLGENSGAQLEGFIERIEGLEAEKKMAGEKIKAEYAAAEGAGFDKAGIKQMVKDRKADLQKTIEFRALVAAYRRALARRAGNALGSLGEWARSWMASEAKVGLSNEQREAKADYARPLDELLKGRKGKDGGKGEGDGGQV
jgi:uncharacterized protein (UPF0335 family)